MTPVITPSYMRLPLHEQNAIERIIRRLIDQGPSYVVILGSDRPMAQYVAPDGNRCAIGLCLPAGTYDPEWEGSNLWTVISMSDIGWSDLAYEGVLFDPETLQDLQELHDQALTTWYHRKNIPQWSDERNPSEGFPTDPSESEITWSFALVQQAKKQGLVGPTFHA